MLKPTTLFLSVLATILCSYPAPAWSADKLMDQLQGDWYQIEVAIFRRQSVMGTEQLVLVQSPTLPQEFTLFRNTDSRSYQLSPQAKAEFARFRPDSNLREARDREVNEGLNLTTEVQIQNLLATYENQLIEESYSANSDQPMMLRDHVTRLKRRGFRMLWHKRWQQPVPERSAPERMLIQIIPGFGNDGQRQDELLGYFAVTLGRYLHIDTKLLFRNPTFTGLEEPREEVLDNSSQTLLRHTLTGEIVAAEPFLFSGSAQLGYMELKEKRRSKKSELHYLDHPLLGVLFKIDPVQPPDALVSQFEQLNDD